MVTKQDIETKVALETTELNAIDELKRWLETHGPPSDIARMVDRLNRIRKITQRVYGSYAVEMALECAYYLGRQSLTCQECGDYIPPNDAYCDCWRDKELGFFRECEACFSPPTQPCKPDCPSSQSS